MSIKCKLTDIETYLNTFNSHFDILCFSETFIKPNEIKTILLEGYELASHFSRRRHCRGGVCIFVKKSLKYQNLDWIEDYSSEKIVECCGISIAELNLKLICIYRPPKSNLNVFYDTLEKILSKVTRKVKNVNKKIVLVGDFNINILEKSNNSNLFISTLKTFNMKCTITEATRVTANSQTCIDNIITNAKKYESIVLHSGLSDHTGQLIKLPCSTGFIIKYWFENIKQIDLNLEIFVKYISQISFSEVYDEHADVNRSYDTFLDIFQMIHDLCFPITKIKVTHKRKPNWKTRGIAKSCQRKRFLYLNIQKNRSADNIDHYKLYKRKLKANIRCSKRLANMRYMSRSSNKTKATWGLIKLHTSPSNDIKQTIDSIKINHNTITNQSDIANLLNRLYVTQNVDNSMNSTYNISFKSISNSIFLTPADEDEIISIVKKLKNKKSSGADGISMKVIKACIIFIAKPLSYLVNKMFETGRFPDKLKLSIVKPLHKKGSKDNPDNYRPIALLPAFSKIFERALYNRLTKFINKNNILNTNQFGFREGKSTTMAVFSTLDKVWDSLNKKKECIGLLLDMSKAFDCVVPSILLKQLYAIGIRGIAYELFQSYFQNRLQSIMLSHYNESTKTVEGIQSHYMSTLLGVPQGSILGPLMFLIYINEMPNLTQHHCVLFADDATVLLVNDNLSFSDFKLEVKNTLNVLMTWLESVNLKTNLTKTQLIQFKHYNAKSLDLDICVNGIQINKVQAANFLGMSLDEHLNWKTHLEKINNKIASCCYALSVLIDVSSVEVARSAYYGNIYPLLTYGIIFWGNSVLVNSTFVLQKRSLRVIYNMKSDDTLRPIFKGKKYLTLTGIYILELCLFVKNNPHLYPRKSEMRTRKTHMRGHDDLHLPTVKTRIFEKSTLVSSIRVFNHLPKYIQSLYGNEFKTTLKKWLIDCVFYDLNEFFEMMT